jgi:hypothetical protein
VWVLGALLAFAIVALWSSLYAQWALSFVGLGSGIQWQDAYRGLEAAESNLPRDPAERERMLVAWAHAEDEPPPGMKIGPRLRRPGTVVRLRYDALDTHGEPIDSWQVRALVPPLPMFAADGAEDPFLGSVECTPECQAALAAGDHVLLHRSGEPGIGAEWLLRMPVGQTFDLGPRSLTTQDLFADTRESHPPAARHKTRKDENAAPVANVRVTLLEACPGDVRLGRVLRLEFHPNATIPIPKGFRTLSWVQLDGCAAMSEPTTTTTTEPTTTNAAAAISAWGSGGGRRHLDASQPLPALALRSLVARSR